MITLASENYDKPSPNVDNNNNGITGHSVNKTAGGGKVS